MNLLQTSAQRNYAMNSLSPENSIIDSLFRFSQYFSAATRPTRFLLTWLVIAQLVLQAFPSLRFLHRNFLSQMTHRCLDGYYWAPWNETVTSRPLRLQTAQLACSLIPVALQNGLAFIRSMIQRCQNSARNSMPFLCCMTMLPYRQALCERSWLRQFDAECPCPEPT